MKKIITLLFISTAFLGQAQVGIGISSASINGSVQLEVASTTKGFLPPRMTYNQKMAISSPAQGLIIYCTNCGSNGEPEYYNGTAWVNMAGGTPASVPITVGSAYGGGIVFYILQPGDIGYDATVQHGLIAATSDQTVSIPIRWHNGVFTVTGATGTAIGTGMANTTAIINNQGSGTGHAAGLARAYNGGGFNDWYLPSKDELNLMYLNKNTIGNFLPDATYHSSSEIQYYYAWQQYFAHGNQIDTQFKDIQQWVRAIRSF